MYNRDSTRVVGVADGPDTRRRGGGLCVEDGRVLQLGHVGHREKVKVADDGATACRLSYARISVNATARGARTAIVAGEEEEEKEAKASK